jgi:hypothetical protein
MREHSMAYMSLARLCGTGQRGVHLSLCVVCVDEHGYCHEITLKESSDTALVIFFQGLGTDEQFETIAENSRMTLARVEQAYTMAALRPDDQGR